MNNKYMSRLRQSGLPPEHHGTCRRQGLWGQESWLWGFGAFFASQIHIARGLH